MKITFDTSTGSVEYIGKYEDVDFKNLRSLIDWWFIDYEMQELVKQKEVIDKKINELALRQKKALY